LKAPTAGPRWALLLLGVVVGLLEREPRPRWTTVPETDGWLAQHEERYEEAVQRARTWLEPLRVDPILLRQHGIKGKKKLVELLDAWLRLHQVAPEAQRGEILAHLDLLAAVTRTPGYHDMQQLDDEAFKQDATSYLRAAYLLDRVGLDVALYRQQIAAIQPRLDAHMPRRGPSQRYMFHRYYAHFGLAEPFPLGEALQEGLIAARKPARDMDRDDAYAVTHEIFGPFDYGDDLEARPFDDDELRYLRRELPHLVRTWIARRDPDVVAELVSCLRYLHAVDLPAYRDGLAFLLRSQAPDGHWGDYAPEAAKIGAWATTYKLELHTTMVTLDALTVAFHPPWNQAVRPLVPD
jgi:hypothetical protein